MQVDRQTEIQKDRCVIIYIQTNGNKDVQTYTDKQTDRRTDSAKVLVQAEKQPWPQFDPHLTQVSVTGLSCTNERV